MTEDEQLEEFVNLSFFGRSRDRDGDAGMDGKGIHRPHFGGNIVRHVRTPAGASFYDQPIGSIITKDQINKIEREKARLGLKPPKGGISTGSHEVQHTEALHKPGTPAKVSEKGPTGIQPIHGSGSTGGGGSSIVHPAPAAPSPVHPTNAARPGAARPVPGLRQPIPPRSQFPKPPASAGVAPERPIQSGPQAIKNIAPTIKGPLTFNVRGKPFSAPTGSTIVRMKSDPEALAFVKAPDGSVHAFNQKGEVTIPPVVAEVLTKKFESGLKNDPNYELAKFDNQDSVPQLKDAKAGAQLHSDAGPEFQLHPEGTWKHTATGTTHDASELDGSYQSGELSYKPAGGDDLASMDQATFVKTVSAMPDGKKLQFVNPRTGEVATLTKSGDKWTSSKRTQASMAPSSLYYLRKHLSSEDDPATMRQVAKATKEGVNKPGAKPAAKAPVKKAATTVKKATPAAKPAAKKPTPAASARKAPAKPRTSLLDAKGAQRRWATPEESKAIERTETPLDTTVKPKPAAASAPAPKAPAPKVAAPKPAPKAEEPKAEPPKPPEPKVEAPGQLNMVAARDLRPGDRFGGGTIVSVHQHPTMKQRVVVRFKGKDGMVRQTDWRGETKISLFNRDEAPAAPKVEAAKVPEPKADEPTWKAGTRLGSGGLRDIKPGARVTGKFTPQGGSALQARADHYLKHEDGSFRHLNGSNMPLGPTRLAMLHGGRGQELTLDHNDAGGHADHPHVGDPATSKWAESAAAGSTMHEQARLGKSVWTKQHDGDWLSDKGEVIGSSEVGTADHSGFAIGPHSPLPKDEPKAPEPKVEAPKVEAPKPAAKAFHELQPGDELTKEHLDALPVKSVIRRRTEGAMGGDQVLTKIGNGTFQVAARPGGNPKRKPVTVSSSLLTLEGNHNHLVSTPHKLEPLPEKKAAAPAKAAAEEAPAHFDALHKDDVLTHPAQIDQAPVGHEIHHLHHESQNADQYLTRSSATEWKRSDGSTVPHDLVRTYANRYASANFVKGEGPKEGHPTPEGMKVHAPEIRMGDKIPHEQWLHDAPEGTSLRYMRRDGSSTLYHKNNANEWVTPVGTRVPSKHLAKEATMGQLRFRSYPDGAKPLRDAVQPPRTLTREWFETQPEGTMIEHGGHVFMKLNGKWVQEDAKGGSHDSASMIDLFFKE